MCVRACCTVYLSLDASCFSRETSRWDFGMNWTNADFMPDIDKRQF